MNNDKQCEIVNLIKKQFLCEVPLTQIDLKHLPLNDLIQEEVINNTVKLDIVLQYPIKINYQKAFLKLLISKIELQKSVVSDSLYEEYGRLVALPTTNHCFKHYFGGKIISLKENACLISDGTTGLRTWQASLALSEWIINNHTSFKGKTILELGSGSGLTGLTIITYCKITAIYLTDCHRSVLDNLCFNIELNCGKSQFSDSFIKLEKATTSLCVKVLDLNWANVDVDLCKKIGKIDKIVAADIVYDQDLFKVLKSAIDCLFQYCEVQEFILSCTERNTNTLQTFLTLIGKDYKIREVAVCSPNIFLWDIATPIRIFLLTP